MIAPAQILPTFVVYALSDTATPTAYRYIGITSNLEQRLKTHLQQARRGAHTYKCAWLRTLTQSPHVTVLAENLTLEDAQIEERATILVLRNNGFCLTNLTDGGEGTIGFKRPPDSLETRQRKRAAKIGRSFSPEHKQALSRANRGKKRSLAQRVAQSQRLTGRKISKEHAEALRVSNIGRKNTPEQLARITQGIRAYHQRRKDGAL